MIHETLYALALILLSSLLLYPPTPFCFSHVLVIFYDPSHRNFAHARLFAWNIFSFTLDLINILQIPFRGITSLGQVDEEWRGSIMGIWEGRAAMIKEKSWASVSPLFNQNCRSLICISQSFQTSEKCTSSCVHPLNIVFSVILSSAFSFSPMCYLWTITSFNVF